MTSNVKKRKFVLALNKMWMPVDIITYKDAFRLMCKDHAMAVDTNMESIDGAYVPHDMNSWIELHRTEHYQHINTVNNEIPVPEIIVLSFTPIGIFGLGWKSRAVNFR